MLRKIVEARAVSRDASIEMLAEMYIAKGDWQTATRYLFQLVPLAPTALERAGGECIAQRDLHAFGVCRLDHEVGCAQTHG